MAVAVTTASGFVLATPQALFETRLRPNFEPFPFQYDTVDGERFLINTPDPATAPTITVLTNWTARLVR